MRTPSRPQRPWDTYEYQRIVSASIQDGEVVVHFADGTEARTSPHHLVSSGGPELDWSNVRAEDFHLVVPSADGPIEIPWDVIRVHTDPEFDAFWAELAAEPVDSRVRSHVNSAP
jgi:hypothetical protein